MKVNKKIISRNYTRGRKNRPIVQIVLHTYGGKGTSLYNWFNRPTTKASAHYAVMKDGTIEQYVEDEDTAWHASNFDINKRSIGSEHQDDGNSNDSIRTNELYSTSSWLVASLCKKYNIPCKLLTKEQANAYGAGISIHQYFANKPCPGGLDINRIINRAKLLLLFNMKPHYDLVKRNDELWMTNITAEHSGKCFVYDDFDGLVAEPNINTKNGDFSDRKLIGLSKRLYTVDWAYIKKDFDNRNFDELNRNLKDTQREVQKLKQELAECEERCKALSQIKEGEWFEKIKKKDEKIKALNEDFVAKVQSEVAKSTKTLQDKLQKCREELKSNREDTEVNASNPNLFFKIIKWLRSIFEES